MSSWTESWSANWLFFPDRAGAFAHVHDRLGLGENALARRPAGRRAGARQDGTRPVIACLSAAELVRMTYTVGFAPTVESVRLPVPPDRTKVLSPGNEE
jgi:hypothetical protein